MGRKGLCGWGGVLVVDMGKVGEVESSVQGGRRKSSGMETSGGGTK